MLTYLLAPEDLGEIRFAISPALEAVLSLRALRDPARFPLQLPWVRRVQPRLAELDREVLGHLMNDRMGSPDFLTPLLSGPLTTYAAELSAIARTDPAEVERQLVAVNGQLPGRLAGPDALGRIVTAMEQYWRVMIEPYWPRMRTILEADVAYRGQAITQDGTAAMLSDLAPTIDYTGGRLRAHQVSNPSREEAVAGRGLVLYPTMFGPGAVIPFDPGHPPELGYPARGQGGLWAMPTRPSPSDLGRLIGHERLRILALLRSRPRTTSDLAVELAVTPSAVSQHLQLLRRTGLADPYRVGKQVFYQPSDLATLLIGNLLAIPVESGLIRVVCCAPITSSAALGVVKVGLEDDDPAVFPAEPSWARVLANTVELATSRRLKAAGRRPPRPGFRQVSRWRRAATFALAVAGVAVVVGWLTGGLTTTSPGTTAASAAGALRPAAPVRAQIQAATWIASQASGSATIGCYPGLCTVLQDRGVAPGRLVFLSAQATSPLGASLLVTSRTAGGTLSARYAPALIASFGSGPDPVEVFAVEPGGIAAYRAALRTDLAARRSAGTQLLHDSRIRFTTTGADRLRAGEVDTRLLATLAVLASQYSFRVTSFGNAAPGAPLLFRGVTVTGIGPGLPAALAMVQAQDVPFVPAHAALTHSGLSIEFGVPSPLGLLSPVLDAGSPAPASASTAIPVKSEPSPKR